MVRIEDLDLGAALDIAGTRRPRAFLAQHHALGAFGVDAKRDFLDVEDDVGDIFTNARDRRELVQNAIDLYGLDGGALQRGQQNAAQSVAERHTEAALERFGDDGRDTLSVTALLDRKLLRLDQVLPVLLDNIRQVRLLFSAQDVQ